MLVSIIIPVYNVESYLRDCLESVVNQTYNNLEIILVDDGSKDNSGAICDEYANKDSRIRVIHQVNQGLSDARNNGFSVSTGDAIFYLDSDDYVDTDIIEKLVNAMVNNNADMAISSVTTVKDNKPLHVFSPIAEATGREILTDHMLQNWGRYITACGKLVKKGKHNITFPTRRISEDTYAIPDLFLNCGKIVGIPDSSYYYIQRSNSITHNYTSKRDFDLFDGYIHMCDLYLNNSFSSTKAMELMVRRTCMQLAMCAKWKNTSEETKTLFNANYAKCKQLIDTVNTRNYSFANKVVCFITFHSPKTMYLIKRIAGKAR